MEDFQRFFKDEMKKEEREIKLKFRKKFKVWAKYVDAHGLPNLLLTRQNLFRCMWMICFMSSAIFCFYSILLFIFQYFDYNVNMNTAIEDQKALNFPAVTICNLDAFDKRYSMNYINKVLDANNISYANEFNITINPRKVYFLVASAMASDANLTIEQKKKFGFDLSYMLLSCTFNYIPCNLSDFVWFYNFDYGPCYTFNSGRDALGNEVPIKKINEYGAENGFDLQLFLGDEFEQGIYMFDSGARVHVHDQSYRPLPKSDGIDLSTNFQTNLAIAKYSVTKLSSPYSNCVQDIDSADGYDSVYFRAMFEVLNVKKYEKKVCLSLCQQDYILKMCSCLDASLPNIYKNESICSNLTAVNCVLAAHSTYSFVSAKCEGCPLECEWIKYKFKSSKSRYPTSYYTHYLYYQTDIVSRFNSKVKVDENHIQKNIIRLNIYFEHLFTTHVYETPAFTTDILLANIGAFLILFLGGSSFLTFLEFLEIIFEYGRFLVNLRNHKLIQKGELIHF